MRVGTTSLLGAGIGVACGAVPAVVGTSPRSSDDWLAPAVLVGGATAVGLAGVDALITRRVLPGAAGVASMAAGAAGGLALAKPAARVVGDPPDAATPNERATIRQALDLLRQTPRGRQLADRLQRDNVEIRVVTDLPGERSDAAGMYNYMSDRILLRRATDATPEYVASVLAHEAQHHADDISAFDGAGLLLTGQLEDRMYDNETRAFGTGARFGVDLLTARGGAADPAKRTPGAAANPALAPILDVLRREPGFDAETGRLKSPEEIRTSLEQRGYANLL